MVLSYTIATLDMPLSQQEREVLEAINANKVSTHRDLIKSMRERRLIALSSSGSFTITPTGLQQLQSSTPKKESK